MTTKKGEMPKIKEVVYSMKEILPKNFENYPEIAEAMSFLAGEELSRNYNAWMYKDIFVPEEIKSDTRKRQTPTILPTGSRKDYIMKIAMLALTK